MIIQYKIKSENKTKKNLSSMFKWIKYMEYKGLMSTHKKKKKREKETVHKWISSDFN